MYTVPRKPHSRSVQGSPDDSSSLYTIPSKNVFLDFLARAHELSNEIYIYDHQWEPTNKLLNTICLISTMFQESSASFFIMYILFVLCFISALYVFRLCNYVSLTHIDSKHTSSIVNFVSAGDVMVVIIFSLYLFLS